MSHNKQNRRVGLILSRKVGERVRIGDNCYITVTDIVGRQVRLGFDFPDQVSILRDELTDKNKECNDEDSE